MCERMAKHIKRNWRPPVPTYSMSEQRIQAKTPTKGHLQGSEATQRSEQTIKLIIVNIKYILVILFTVPELWPVPALLGTI